MQTEFIEITETYSKDWGTLIFILCWVGIIYSKTIYEARFQDFLKLIFNDKYLKIHKENAPIDSTYTIVLFLIQLISFSFFIQLLLDQFGWVSKYDFRIFLQIFTLLGTLIISKYLIEKIIATAFDIDDFTELFNFHKINYRTYAALFLLPFNMVFFFNDISSTSVFLIAATLLVAFNVFTYFRTLKFFQNLLLSKLFYFILYLCALEIAPYYFMYYWLSKR